MDAPGNAGTGQSPDRVVSNTGSRRRADVAVLQCGLCAEVEIVGDECGGDLWSGISAVGDCSGRMASEEGVSCVVDCEGIMELRGTCPRLH